MYWRLLPHATVCSVGDDLIILDTRADRYCAVPPALTSPFRRWLDGDHCNTPSPIIELLRRSDILRSGDAMSDVSMCERVAVPTALMSPIWDEPERGASKFGVAAVVGMTRLSLRLRPLQAILEDHWHPSVARTLPGPDMVAAACASFDRARAYSPIPRRCLLDTLALDAWLGDLTRGCKMVFGVTARPFKAHCWLQSPHMVLNDSYDHVSRYAPILSL